MNECITETGHITKSGPEGVEIDFEASSACAKCGLCSSRGSDRSTVIVRDGAGLPIGTAVRVLFPYNARWLPIFFVFALPLALFMVLGIAGALVASLLGLSEGVGGFFTAVAAAVGLVGGLFGARGYDRHFHRRVYEEARVEPIMPEE